MNHPYNVLAVERLICCGEWSNATRRFADGNVVDIVVDIGTKKVLRGGDGSDGSERRCQQQWGNGVGGGSPGTAR